MSDPHSHNALVQRTFHNPKHVVGELQAVLPKQLCEDIDWSTLKRLPGDFVDKKLKWRYTDLLYRVELRGRPVLLYTLLEVQASVSPLMPLRLYIYMGRIWEVWLWTKERPRTPPPIIPIVLHHGNGRWNLSLEFLDQFDLDDATKELLAPYLPTFRFVLDDLAVEPDEMIL